MQKGCKIYDTKVIVYPFTIVKYISVMASYVDMPAFGAGYYSMYAGSAKYRALYLI